MSLTIIGCHKPLSSIEVMQMPAGTGEKENEMASNLEAKGT